MSRHIFFYDTMLGVFSDLLISNGKKGYKFVGEASLLGHKLVFGHSISYDSDGVGGVSATVIPSFTSDDSSLVNGIILEVKDSVLDILSRLYPVDVYEIVSKKFLMVSKKGNLKKVKADMYILRSPILEREPSSEYLLGMRDGYKTLGFNTSVIDDVLVPLLVVEKNRAKGSCEALLELMGYDSLEDMLIKGIFGDDSEDSDISDAYEESDDLKEFEDEEESNGDWEYFDEEDDFWEPLVKDINSVGSSKNNCVNIDNEVGKSRFVNLCCYINGSPTKLFVLVNEVGVILGYLYWDGKKFSYTVSPFNRAASTAVTDWVGVFLKKKDRCHYELNVENAKERIDILNKYFRAIFAGDGIKDISLHNVNRDLVFVVTKYFRSDLISIAFLGDGKILKEKVVGGLVSDSATEEGVYRFILNMDKGYTSGFTFENDCSTKPEVWFLSNDSKEEESSVGTVDIQKDKGILKVPRGVILDKKE